MSSGEHMIVRVCNRCQEPFTATKHDQTVCEWCADTDITQRHNLEAMMAERRERAVTV